jgi:hypothetical protein
VSTERGDRTTASDGELALEMAAVISELNQRIEALKARA